MHRIVSLGSSFFCFRMNSRYRWVFVTVGDRGDTPLHMGAFDGGGASMFACYLSRRFYFICARIVVGCAGYIYNPSTIHRPPTFSCFQDVRRTTRHCVIKQIRIQLRKEQSTRMAHLPFGIMRVVSIPRRHRCTRHGTGEHRRSTTQRHRRHRPAITPTEHTHATRVHETQPREILHCRHLV